MRLVIGLVCMISLLLTGCGDAADNRDASSPNSAKDRKHEIRVRQSVPAKPEIKDNRAVSGRLAELAASVPNVQDATCVVIGNTAIVGIDVEGDLDRSRVGTLKYSVAEALRKDPYGAYAIVTADIDIMNRLREINRAIQAGRPVSGFAEELADIIGRIMPELPRDTDPPADRQESRDVRRRIGNKNLVR